MKQNLMQLTYSLGVGGLETLLLSLLNKIDKNKFNPIVCTLTDTEGLGEEFRNNGIKVISLGKKRGIDFGLVMRLARLLKQERIDVLHTHNFGAWYYGVLAAKIAGVQVVNTEHSNVPESKKLQMYGEKFMAKASHSIICDSQAVADYMNRMQSIPMSKIKIILNGVDTEQFKKHLSDSPLKSDLGISKSTTVIGCIARLHPRKNHLGLLNACLRLRRQEEDFKVLIIGDGASKEELMRFSEDNDLMSNVIFLGNRRDIHDLLSVIDIFVLNSFDEGLPIAILEAMAMSIPVIATDVGGNAEILGRDNRAGVLIPVDSPDQLANELYCLIKDEIKRYRMGATARERVEEKASLVSMVKSYENVYLECVGG